MSYENRDYIVNALKDKKILREDIPTLIAQQNELIMQQNMLITSLIEAVKWLK